MKTFSLLIVIFQLGLTVAAVAYEPSTIETAQGKVYVGCKVLKRDPDGVSFSHSKGMAKVLYSEMSVSMRNMLGYDAGKADAYEREQAATRQAAAEAKRVREAKLAEAVIAAQSKYAAQQPVIYMQQPNGGYMRSLAPVLGLGQMGNYYYGGGHHGHGYGYGTGQGRSWTNGGVGSVGAGSGGVYVPRGGGINFNGFPAVSYSPTLGYTNLNNNQPVIFGPLGQSSTGTGVVPGVATHGSMTTITHSK